MKKFISIPKFALFCVLAIALGGCLKDLDREPFVEVTTTSVYKDAASYKLVLAKLYAGLAVSGQQGPSGKADITGIDEGFSTYLRQYWKAQELTTDNAVIAWLDGSLPDYHEMDWTSGNEFVAAMYNRIYYQIALVNEFIRESEAGKLSGRGISGQDATNIGGYRAEARFLRALSYYHALDMFGAVPFVTEKDLVGAFLPNQTSRGELFAYVESELNEIIPLMAEARQNEYGRADKAAAQTLLAKLYLNAETYIGAPKYSECIAQCQAVLTPNAYQLEGKYADIFAADNDNSNEIIFPIRFDGVRTKTFGGMTFLVHASVGGTMLPADFGINGGWNGLRATSKLVQFFNDTSGLTDKRAMFWFDGQTREISQIKEFTQGYAVTKYRNITKAGLPGSDATGDFPDNDFPLFRLADVHLMAAEAHLRGGAGLSDATALEYVNQLVRRAHSGSTDFDLTSLNLENLFAERSRELYWEAQRRTDLIRFGRFTSGDYVWPFKGNDSIGVAVSDHLKLFPIPASDLIANPKLDQNPGY